jgi:hypothetical protein
VHRHPSAEGDRIAVTSVGKARCKVITYLLAVTPMAHTLLSPT